MEEQGVGRAEQAVEKARLRLHDAASDLRPLPTSDELRQRIQSVVHQLREIEHDLILASHIDDIEHGGLEDELAAIDKKLADGWQPESRPVADVVRDLRSAIR